MNAERRLPFVHSPRVRVRLPKGGSIPTIVVPVGLGLHATVR